MALVTVYNISIVFNVNNKLVIKKSKVQIEQGEAVGNIQNSPFQL